jgi:Arc/MetJ-type ribon-helix-helix transcriptional regulator
MEKEKGGITYWNVPVPKPLDEALEEAIKQDWHRTKTEFIREVVRKELERMGLKPRISQ